MSFMKIDVSTYKKNKNNEYMEKMKFCDIHVSSFEECLKDKKSTNEDIRRAFYNLVNCEKKHGLNVYN